MKMILGFLIILMYIYLLQHDTVSFDNIGINILKMVYCFDVLIWIGLTILLFGR